MTRLRFLLLPVLILTFALLGCTPEPEVPPDTSVVNEALGVRLAEIPTGLTVTRNEGATFELVPSTPDATGTISFRVGPEETGINLIAAMKEHEQRIESLPGGDYKGGQELAGPLGTAFYSRGRHQEEGGVLTEEATAFSIHPKGNRLLEIRYVYPAGADSGARVSELLGVLAQVEAPSTTEGE